MQEKQDLCLGIFRAGSAGSVTVADKMGAGRGGRRAGVRQYHVFSEVIMKVVLIDNPRFISCLLRMMFGIKKEKQNAE